MWLKSWLTAIAAVVMVMQKTCGNKVLTQKTGCLVENSVTLKRNIRSTIECTTLCLASQTKCVSVTYEEETKQCFLSTKEATTCDTPTTLYQDVNVCPDTYVENPDTGLCLRLVTTALTWQAAHDACVADGEYLLTFSSAAESVWLRNKIPELSAENSMWGGYIYIGAKDASGNNNDYRWYGVLTGSITGAQSDWSTNQPNSNSEQCVVLTSSGWHDYPCSPTKPFICQKLTN